MYFFATLRLESISVRGMFSYIKGPVKLIKRVKIAHSFLQSVSDVKIAHSFLQSVSDQFHIIILTLPI